MKSQEGFEDIRKDKGADDVGFQHPQDKTTYVSSRPQRTITGIRVEVITPNGVK